jgi:hypothetical protein
METDEGPLTERGEWQPRPAPSRNRLKIHGQMHHSRTVINRISGFSRTWDSSKFSIRDTVLIELYTCMDCSSNGTGLIAVS